MDRTFFLPSYDILSFPSEPGGLSARPVAMAKQGDASAHRPRHKSSLVSFAARGVFAKRLAEHRRAYDRDRDLPGLLPLWPSERTDTSVEGRQRIVAALKRALREERRRGVAGHWGYDLARHDALYRALRHELATLQEASRKTREGTTRSSGEAARQA